MTVYQGDSYTFILNLPPVGGVAQNVTVNPVIQIINAQTGLPVLSAAPNMTLVAGTTTVYTYTWVIPFATLTADYFAVVSYVANGTTATTVYLDRIRVGSSRVLGVVALDATVAKQATVALDATVAHSSDLTAISPDNSTSVQAILTKVNTLPAAPADNSLLLSVQSALADVKDGVFGTVLISRTASPMTYQILRASDNSLLASYTLTETDSTTTRTLESLA